MLERAAAAHDAACKHALEALDARSFGHARRQMERSKQRESMRSNCSGGIIWTPAHRPTLGFHPAKGVEVPRRRWEVLVSEVPDEPAQRGHNSVPALAVDCGCRVIEVPAAGSGDSGRRDERVWEVVETSRGDRMIWCRKDSLMPL